MLVGHAQVVVSGSFKMDISVNRSDNIIIIMDISTERSQFVHGLIYIGLLHKPVVTCKCKQTMI